MITYTSIFKTWKNDKKTQSEISSSELIKISTNREKYITYITNTLDIKSYYFNRRKAYKTFFENDRKVTPSIFTPFIIENFFDTTLLLSKILEVKKDNTILSINDLPNYLPTFEKELYLKSNFNKVYDNAKKLLPVLSPCKYVGNTKRKEDIIYFSWHYLVDIDPKDLSDVENFNLELFDTLEEYIESYSYSPSNVLRPIFKLEEIDLKNKKKKLTQSIIEIIKTDDYVEMLDIIYNYYFEKIRLLLQDKGYTLDQSCNNFNRSFYFRYGEKMEFSDGNLYVNNKLKTINFDLEEFKYFYNEYKPLNKINLDKSKFNESTIKELNKPLNLIDRSKFDLEHLLSLDKIKQDALNLINSTIIEATKNNIQFFYEGENVYKVVRDFRNTYSGLLTDGEMLEILYNISLIKDNNISQVVREKLSYEEMAQRFEQSKPQSSDILRFIGNDNLIYHFNKYKTIVSSRSKTIQNNTKINKINNLLLDFKDEMIKKLIEKSITNSNEEVIDIWIAALTDGILERPYNIDNLLLLMLGNINIVRDKFTGRIIIDPINDFSKFESDNYTYDDVKYDYLNEYNINTLSLLIRKLYYIDFQKDKTSKEIFVSKNCTKEIIYNFYFNTELCVNEYDIFKQWVNYLENNKISGTNEIDKLVNIFKENSPSSNIKEKIYQMYITILNNLIKRTKKDHIFYLVDDNKMGVGKSFFVKNLLLPTILTDRVEKTVDYESTHSDELIKYTKNLIIFDEENLNTKSDFAKMLRSLTSKQEVNIRLSYTKDTLTLKTNATMFFGSNNLDVVSAYQEDRRSVIIEFDTESYNKQKDIDGTSKNLSCRIKREIDMDKVWREIYNYTITNNWIDTLTTEMIKTDNKKYHQYTDEDSLIDDIFDFLPFYNKNIKSMETAMNNDVNTALLGFREIKNILKIFDNNIITTKIDSKLKTKFKKSFVSTVNLTKGRLRDKMYIRLKKNSKYSQEIQILDNFRNKYL